MCRDPLHIKKTHNIIKTIFKGIKLETKIYNILQLIITQEESLKVKMSLNWNLIKMRQSNNNSKQANNNKLFNNK